MKNDTDRRYVSNGIAHFDIAGPDLARLREFYSAVFGWSAVERGPGYASLTTPAGSADGALIESKEASLTIGVVVPDIARSLAVALAHGGTIGMPATDNGWVVKAQIVDPAGNHVTLIAG